MDAARILRREGIDLIGTELEPDWRMFGGASGRTSLASVRVDHPPKPFDERESYEKTESTPALLLDDNRRKEYSRVLNNIPQPNYRFHYRYRAASLAWKATQMMPDDTEETARALWEAGRWVADRDPDFADPFYKALVRRNPNIALAQEADRKRWFPKADEEGEPILPGVIESAEVSPGLEETPEPRKLWTALPWHDDLESATREALAQNRPVYIELGNQDDCSSGRQLHNYTYESEEIWDRLNSGPVLCFLDPSLHPEMRKRFGGECIPTLIVMNATGEIAWQESGYLDFTEFEDKVLTLLDWVPVMNQIEQAHQEKRDSDLEEWSQMLDAMLPDDGDRLVELSNSWVTTHRTFPASAVVLSQKALNLSPDDVHAQHGLALAEMSAGFLDSSIERLRSLSDREVGAAELYLAMALSLRAQPGDAEEAQRVLNKYSIREQLPGKGK